MAIPVFLTLDFVVSGEETHCGRLLYATLVPH